jgi:hypothetical protein
MRYIILIFTFFSLLSCKNSESKTQIEISKAKDINEIVQAIIIEDSLNVSKKAKDSRMFCEELLKLNIYVPEKPKNGKTPPPPPPSFNDVSVEDLLHYKKSGLFNAKDSLHLLEQNSNPQKFKINKILFEKVNLTTREIEINKRKTGKPFSFYEMTIPVFSRDNQKAFVQLNHYCGGLCGNGVSLYSQNGNKL